jgi:hypothetical protein
MKLSEPQDFNDIRMRAISAKLLYCSRLILTIFCFRPPTALNENLSRKVLGKEVRRHGNGEHTPPVEIQ